MLDEKTEAVFLLGIIIRKVLGELSKKPFQLIARPCNKAVVTTDDKTDISRLTTRG